ncbi:MAG TPA: copper chaperone PCu(A)C [Wenzhouxiangella sp.]
MRTLIALIVLFGLPFASAHAQLEITDAWSPEAPPGRTMAGFMTLENTSDEAVVLMDGQSPQFGRIEIHDMINDDGVMRMRRLDQLVIEPNETVSLKPGSFHLMLMEPKVTLAPGDAIDLVFVDGQGNDHPITLMVRPR